jgi:hypothetical protein
MLAPSNDGGTIGQAARQIIDMHQGLAAGGEFSVFGEKS